jgi:uncharacterized protein (DUF2267 family)
MAHPYEVERATDLHMQWCRDLAQRMGVNTTHQSGPQMRAVMHELRRALSPDCVLTVANALPALERGIFLDGWTLQEEHIPAIDAELFCERVFERVRAHHFRVPSLVADVFWLWSQKLEPEKADAIRRCLPGTLAEL